MKQKITGFHLDEENHWVAELECGHGQHMRHDPPWMERPWVLTKEGRDGRLGQTLNCVRCDEMGAKVAAAIIEASRKSLTEAYEDAGISGLCDKGRWEMAIESLKQLDLPSILNKALSSEDSSDSNNTSK